MAFGGEIVLITALIVGPICAVAIPVLIYELWKEGWF
jgi:hypothetical protein